MHSFKPHPDSLPVTETGFKATLPSSGAGMPRVLPARRSGWNFVAVLLALFAGFVLTTPLAFAQETAGPGFVPGPWVRTTPQASLTPDGEWYRQTLVKHTDLWNGGPTGMTALGSYRPDFDGRFNLGIDQQWRQNRNEPTTVIGQCRAIYANVEAWRAAGPEAGRRFLEAAEKGADYLITRFRDPVAGGYYWMVNKDGKVTQDNKQGYGHMKVLFALSQLARESKNPVYQEKALEVLDVIQKNLTDPGYPGAILPGKDRQFRLVQGVKNSDTYTHYIEALESAWDMASGVKKEEIGKLLTLAGNFFCQHLVFPVEGDASSVQIAYNYAPDWTPSREPYTRNRQWDGAALATPGHAIEVAWLLSRAVERGFNKDWLVTARKLLDYCIKYAIDPVTGGMRYDTLDYAGRPLQGNPDNAVYTWWPQTETARTLLHFAVLRDPSLAAAFHKAEAFVMQNQMDQKYGGLYPQISASSLKPAGSIYKGNQWKTSYHLTMYFAEAIRLGKPAR